MKKLFVAAAVLVLAGVAVAGAFHVKQSLCNGVCPLTGRPIAHHAMTRSADSGPVGFNLTGAGEAAPAASAVAGDDGENVCPKTRRHCCCPNRQECEPAKQVVEAPVAPTQNP